MRGEEVHEARTATLTPSEICVVRENSVMKVLVVRVSLACSAFLTTHATTEHTQLTATTGTSGDASLIDSRRPVLHSQHIPTFRNAERQHISSRFARELSFFTRWQHYDDCGYTA